MVGGKFDSMETKREEIKNGIEIVGPIPGLVFNSWLFQDAILRSVDGAVEATRDISNSVCTRP